MKTIILTALLSVGLTAQANQDSATTSALEFSKEEAQVAPRGVLPFLGLGGGYTGYDTNGAAEGTPSTLKLLGSWYLESPWVMDLGYGVNNQQFSQASGSQETAITDGALEFAARYRFDSRWQLGVVANQLYNQGENYLADQADAHFVGLQLLREFNMTPSWLARLGLRAQSLTNNTDGLVNMYLIDLQIGWNPGAYKTSVRSTAATEPTQPEEPMYQPAAEPARPVAIMEAPESALRDVNMNMIAGAGSAIQFRSSQYAISGADQRKLSQVAKVLNENPDLVEKVEVHGFADASGSEETNQRISQARADSVKSIIERNGFTNVEAVGKGATDSTGIKAQDRRAELIFIGVRDEDALRRALSEIR
ncbi:OmpA family protein [Bdellovibrio bacteriovorus]|uniref:OmpA family protein n=1 Tax=Bdellovibrio bacteriovorus TaxID=959 RepID=UPI0021D1530E|nr:OmpA family protein [Bdellovibrio bacteriovorus]UXR63732.1 OmpA family protein [Bdellovibrio bacteriovorus]